MLRRQRSWDALGIPSNVKRQYESIGIEQKRSWDALGIPSMKRAIPALVILPDQFRARRDAGDDAADEN